MNIWTGESIWHVQKKKKKNERNFTANKISEISKQSHLALRFALLSNTQQGQVGATLSPLTSMHLRSIQAIIYNINNKNIYIWEADTWQT